MKRLFVILVFVLAACLLLSACGKVQVTPSPTVSNTEAISTPTPEPTPAVTPGPTSEEDDEIDYDIGTYSYEIKQAADNCRRKIGDTEYYLDTSRFIQMHVFPDFPLYRYKDGESRPEYLGTTGFSFQVRGQFIYVESDLLYEDSPEYGATRIVDINDLNIISIGRNVNIFFPKQGSDIYYTKGANESIFIADPSSWEPKELPIELPDKDTIEQRIEQSIDDVCISIDITDVKDGWIYFSYDLFEPEGPGYYNGNYRIRTDGSRIEKIGEGKFGDEIDYED